MRTTKRAVSIVKDENYYRVLLEDMAVQRVGRWPTIWFAGTGQQRSAKGDGMFLVNSWEAG